MLHALVPAVATYGYLNLPREQLRNIPDGVIYWVSIFHNLGLHIFSCYHFCAFMSILFRHGVIAGRGAYFDIPGVDALLLSFYLSKYYEYMDTAILYAKGKEPIFLQKFHHVGAAVVWHVGYVYRFDGVYFASLINSGIHTVMYLYYLLSMFPMIRRRISSYKVYITSAQVAQLGFGAVALPWYYYSIESDWNRGVIWLFDIYIGCLLVLFLRFMVVNYWSRRKAE